MADPREYRRSFSVDARLLRELGERLVGQPHIALAELIKNAYDADARVVEISVDEDSIVIEDDGHGMSEQDFLTRWMRIGTGEKERERVTPELKRPMTGSKGIGRLAAQLLSKELILQSVGLRDRSLSGLAERRSATAKQLHSMVAAQVEWGGGQADPSVDHDLEEVLVDVTVGEPRVAFAQGSRSGTRIELRGLTSKWGSSQLRSLAQELWVLQPPFDAEPDDDTSFHIVLKSARQFAQSAFDDQMQAVLDIWTARVTGQLLDPDAVKGRPAARFDLSEHLGALRGVDLDLDDDLKSLFSEEDGAGSRPKVFQVIVELRDAKPRRIDIAVPYSAIDEVEYEIRVFNLRYRQPKGVGVDDARHYLNRFGGVHIHDGGFRLPYYGPDQDWLRIEQEHAHRRSRSRLLPTELQTADGLRDLPTNSRLYGTVKVSTARESATASEVGRTGSDVLTMQVTRDRLVDNRAFRQLAALMRTALHLYAMESARARIRPKDRRPSPPKPAAAADELRAAVEAIRERVPADVHASLEVVAERIDEAAKATEQNARSHTSLLGSLATAGIMSLAYEHEAQKQLALLDAITDRLEKLSERSDDHSGSELQRLVTDLRSAREGADRLRRVFSVLLDEESRTAEGRFGVSRVVREVAGNLQILARGTEIDVTGLLNSLKFPPGTYPAWSSIVQNILINAFNALLDSRVKKIAVDGGSRDGRSFVRFQDTGVGVDLRKAESYFEPFVRGMQPSRERAALGLGGSGLGLTIVRMIADDLGCSIRFVEPNDEYSTAIQVDWMER